MINQNDRENKIKFVLNYIYQVFISKKNKSKFFKYIIFQVYKGGTLDKYNKSKS